MIIKYIKSWDFDEASRKDTTLIQPDKVRLNTQMKNQQRAQLKAQRRTAYGKDIYSTDPDLAIRTKSTYPHALQQWLKFEAEYNTSEPDFREFNLKITNKVGNTVDYEEHQVFLPQAGDRVFQGDLETTITSVEAGKLNLTNATGFTAGRIYILRSRCSVNFCIYNSLGTRYWYNVSTSQWEVASLGQWNTMFQINNHISSLSIATFGKTIGIDVNLKTTDPLYTPLISKIKLLGKFDIEFTEDLIFDTLMRLVRSEFDATTSLGVRLTGDTSTINLATDYKPEDNGYRFTDVHSVYNITNDPDRLVNLAHSYTVGAARPDDGNYPGIVALSSIQDAGDVLEINLNYYPVTSVNTANDFYEVNQLPSIVFERIEKAFNMHGNDSSIGEEYIRDKLAMTGVQMQPPDMNDLIFGFAVFTGNQTDQHRIGEALRRFLNQYHHVWSWGLDVPYPMTVKDVFRSANTPNTSNVNTHTGEFTIHNVYIGLREPKDVYLIDDLTLMLTTS